MATISKSQLRFLFLQVLLLSSHCLDHVEASASSAADPGGNLNDAFTTSSRDAAANRVDNLRGSSKLSEESSSTSSSSSSHLNNNATTDMSTTNTTTSFSEEEEEERQLRTKTKQHSSTTTVDLSQTPIQIPVGNHNKSSSSSSNGGDGIKDNMFRIVGGNYHDGNGMPNFAMLLSRTGDEYFSSGCGGSLISPCHVLTAAHCVDNPSQMNSGMAIYLNAYRPWGDNNGLTSHFTTVSAYSIHPSYANSVNSRPVNDVAVLTMAKCVDQNDEDKNLFLHNIMELATLDDWNNSNNNNRLYHGQSLKVSGFGSTVVTGIGGNSKEYSEVLKTVSVPFQAQCSRQGFYSAGLVQDNDMMCAGGTGHDACFGDSGGPLYHEYSSTSTRHPRRKQYGIVSWGHGCGIANKPGVYASVAHHYDYIKRIVCSNPNVQMLAWGGSGTSVTASNMCGTRQASPTRRPTKPPTPAPTRRPTRAPVTSRPTTPEPTRKPTRSPTSAPTARDNSNYTFEDGSTAERKERSSVNDKVAQKLSGGSYESSLSRIRGGGANKPNNNNNPGRRRARTRQLGSDAVQGPEEQAD